MGTLGAVDGEVGVGDGAVEEEGCESGDAVAIVVLSRISIEDGIVCIVVEVN